MAEEVKGTETQTQTEIQTQTQQKEEKKETGTQTQTNAIDIEKAKNEALSSFLKDLGVDDADSLRGIVTKAREEEDKNKTELQRSNDSLAATTKELASEREARIMAEAKLSAIQLGAKPELVDDLVVVAKSKVTKDKDINAVIAEIKDGTSGKVYFQSDDEEEETDKSKTKGKTVTRARVTKPSEKNDKSKKETNETETEEEKKHTGSMAERLLSGRKEKKGHYFK